MADLPTRKRVRDDSVGAELDPSDVKKLRDDILSFLDESDPDPTVLELDFVMKSLEEEISPASSSPLLCADQQADSGESQPELGYLLEASDDELGLPPSEVSTCLEVTAEGSELVRVSSDSSEIGEFWGFDDQIPTYDSFDFAEDNRTGSQLSKAEYVAFDGLFDHSDDWYYETTDCSEFSWRHETTPAQ